VDSGAALLHAAETVRKQEIVIACCLASRDPSHPPRPVSFFFQFLSFFDIPQQIPSQLSLLTDFLAAINLRAANPLVLYKQPQRHRSHREKSGSK
jgi:hypothetical protein